VFDEFSFTGSATLIYVEGCAVGQVKRIMYWAYWTKVFGGIHVVALL
jgi:hypothetical protein